jgi:hypothetical protein
MAGHDDNGHIQPAFIPQQIQAIAIGQAPIRNDEARRLPRLIQMRPGFCQRRGNLQVHFTAAHFKSLAHELGVSGIIFDKQYLQGLVC